MVLTHDCQRDSVDNGLSQCLIRSVALVDDIVLTLRDHNIHVRGRHKAALQRTQRVTSFSSMSIQVIIDYFTGN